MDDLDLRRLGYDVSPFGPYYVAFPTARSITIHGDYAAATHASVERFSKADAEAFP